MHNTTNANFLETNNGLKLEKFCAYGIEEFKSINIFYKFKEYEVCEP